MILSYLSVGRVTFIIRVAIQILAYGGIALLGIIVLAQAPRIADIRTHGLINRLVGAGTHIKEAVIWLYLGARGRHVGGSPSKHLAFAITLYILYSTFVFVSDIGFLGFYGCSVPGNSFMDRPASINSSDSALTLVEQNVIKGTVTTLATLRVFRCNAVGVGYVTVGTETVTVSQCTAWQNATYADRAVFGGLNSTDSDVLMPRQLAYSNAYNRSTYLTLNSYYLGPSAKRITTTTIRNGIIVHPHNTGSKAVMGVPSLPRDTRVRLDRTLAVELEVGCMSLGIYSQHQLSSNGLGFDLFATKGTWRKYEGPTYMEDILVNYTDQIRSYLRPLFNVSSLDSYGYLWTNKSTIPLSPAAGIKTWRIPDRNDTDSTFDWELRGNCTATLEERLGIVSPYSKAERGTSCGLLGVGGTLAEGYSGFSRMICATSTQVNMVSAEVRKDADGSTMLNTTRLPSDLHYLYAEYWDVAALGLPSDGLSFASFPPIERFTLSPNSSSPMSHYIPNYEKLGFGLRRGPGSPGNLITSLGSAMMNMDQFSSDYSGIITLDQGFEVFNLTAPKTLTEWAGQVAASFILESLSYNGWAALDKAPVLVSSTGGHIGTCFKPLFALAFLPLVLAACCLVVWLIVLALKSSLAGTSILGEHYGGLNPYLHGFHEGEAPTNPILLWEKFPEQRLRFLADNEVMVDYPNEPAVRFLNSKQDAEDTSSLLNESETRGA